MTYTIGEVAERTGFSASALRYYEDIGLVTPAARSDAGYRLYDDRVLSRLAFVARATSAAAPSAACTSWSRPSWPTPAAGPPS
jgi:DNA-binding transcriptional MerR regulator